MIRSENIKCWQECGERQLATVETSTAIPENNLAELNDVMYKPERGSSGGWGGAKNGIGRSDEINWEAYMDHRIMGGGHKESPCTRRREAVPATQGPSWAQQVLNPGLPGAVLGPCPHRVCIRVKEMIKSEQVTLLRRWQRWREVTGRGCDFLEACQTEAGSQRPAERKLTRHAAHGKNLRELHSGSSNTVAIGQVRLLSKEDSQEQPLKYLLYKVWTTVIILKPTYSDQRNLFFGGGGYHRCEYSMFLKNVSGKITRCTNISFIC